MQVCELAAMILEYFNVELYLVRYLHYSVFCGHFYTILSITCVCTLVYSCCIQVVVLIAFGPKNGIKQLV